MEDVKFVCGQQGLKHIFVFFNDIFHKHVRLFDQATYSLHMTTGSKTAVILKNLQGLRIAKEITKKPQFTDWLIGQTGIQISCLHCFVDNCPSVTAFKKSTHFSLVIFSCSKPAFLHRFEQFSIRARIGECVSNCITGIPWRHHPSPMAVLRTLTKFVTINKFGIQNHRLNEFAECLLPFKLTHEQS